MAWGRGRTRLDINNYFWGTDTSGTLINYYILIHNLFRDSSIVSFCYQKPIYTAFRRPVSLAIEITTSSRSIISMM